MAMATTDNGIGNPTDMMAMTDTAMSTIRITATIGRDTITARTIMVHRQDSITSTTSTANATDIINERR